MKFTDWLWLIWGLAFPILGTVYFGVVGFVIGIILYVIYVWLIRMSKKPKEELQSSIDGTVDKLNAFTSKTESLTERIRADTKRRRSKRIARKNSKNRTRE